MYTVKAGWTQAGQAYDDRDGQIKVRMDRAALSQGDDIEVLCRDGEAFNPELFGGEVSVRALIPMDRIERGLIETSWQRTQRGLAQAQLSEDGSVLKISADAAARLGRAVPAGLDKVTLIVGQARRLPEGVAEQVAEQVARDLADRRASQVAALQPRLRA